ETMRLSQYEKDVRREIEDWQRGEANVFMQAFNWAMKPMDWVVERVVPPSVVDQASGAIEQFLGALNDASEWTYDTGDTLEEARRAGIQVEKLEDLRDHSLEPLDALA